jgi:hypothetical protein
MSGFSTSHHGGGAAGLASQLAAIADDASRAAMYAEGEYIPQLTREDELRRAFLGAGAIAARLEQLKREVAKLGSGDNCLLILQHAIEDLEAGRTAIQDGIRTTEDLLQNGVVVIDAVATGTAAIHFREVTTIVRGIADIATLEAVPCVDLFRAITGLA